MITPVFWARWLLWSHPTLASAKAHISKQFDIVIRRGKPPQYLKKPQDKAQSTQTLKALKHLNKHQTQNNI